MSEKQETEENFWYDEKTQQKMHFDDNGKFVDEEGNGPKKGFNLSDKFSDWIHAYIVRQMLARGLKEICHPENGAPIYASPNAFNNPKKLLVVIQGTGRVRAGVWSVGVCAYTGLDAGSVLSAMREASQREMEIVILNPNDERNKVFSQRYKTNIGMVRHTLAIFEDLIIPANPENVFILCHSMGGECTVSVIKKFPQWAIEHIRAIAMTDACESRVTVEGLKMRHWCIDHNANWICSTYPPNHSLVDGIASQHFSAGTKDHPLSTWKAWPFIWPFFDSKGAANNAFETVDITKYQGVEEIVDETSEEELVCRP